jgi:hypothetical protein
MVFSPYPGVQTITPHDSPDIEDETTPVERQQALLLSAFAYLLTPYLCACLRTAVVVVEHVVV